MQRLTLTLLGGFHGQLRLGSPLVLPRHRGQALLAYLALPLGQPHTRGKLANLLWSDQPSRQARMSVRQLLFSVRRALADSDGATLLLEGDTVALNPAAVDLDVAAFERAVADGSRAALEHAVALYSGELLAGLDVSGQAFDEWMMGERVRLKELATGTLSKLLGHQRAAGDLDAAVQSALRLLALDPLQESAHRMLMRLYAEQGRWGAALRHYQ